MQKDEVMVDLNKLSPEALKAAMEGGTEAWGQWGSTEDHGRYLQPIASRSRVRCHCGCKTRATHIGMCNGVGLSWGCEMKIRRWVNRQHYVKDGEQMNDNVASTEMPKYISHKTVWALKIGGLTDSPGPKYGAMMRPAKSGYADIHLSRVFMDKHSPEVGGYYVVYADGYKSFSPAKAFEEGYTLIE